MGTRSFRSDNNAGICLEAMQAIVDVNAAHEVGYGDDVYSQRAVEAFHEVFGSEVAVFFVATGTAANTLAIAALTEPWQQVICHGNCHYNFDESTAPERITHCRMARITSESPKLTSAQIETAAIGARGDVHHPQPGVITISNATEFGTVYTPDEVAAICATAHAMGYRVHVDGARFANAVAALGCQPHELANDAGVDALSFGGTKNGMAMGEAVIFFPQGNGSDYARAVHSFPFHRKGTGHLLSKHRFVSTPFAAMLASGAWLRHAAHANAMAQRLAEGLAECRFEPAFPVEANAVFVRLPLAVDEQLRQAGQGYYHFEAPQPDGTVLARLMCSFNTTAADVAAFVSEVQRACERASI